MVLEKTLNDLQGSLPVGFNRPGCMVEILLESAMKALPAQRKRCEELRRVVKESRNQKVEGSTPKGAELFFVR